MDKRIMRKEMGELDHRIEEFGQRVYSQPDTHLQTIVMDAIWDYIAFQVGKCKDGLTGECRSDIKHLALELAALLFRYLGRPFPSDVHRNREKSEVLCALDFIRNKTDAFIEKCLDDEMAEAPKAEQDKSLGTPGGTKREDISLALHDDKETSIATTSKKHPSDFHTDRERTEALYALDFISSEIDVFIEDGLDNTMADALKPDQDMTLKLPAGTKWENISFAFHNDQEASIAIAGQMRLRRSIGKYGFSPILHVLLIRFALETELHRRYGAGKRKQTRNENNVLNQRLRLESPIDKDRSRMGLNVHKLRDKLKNLFPGVEGDPLPYRPNEHGWVPAFKISYPGE